MDNICLTIFKLANSQLVSPRITYEANTRIKFSKNLNWFMLVLMVFSVVINGCFYRNFTVFLECLTDG